MVEIKTSCPNCGFCFERSQTQQLHAKTTCDPSQSRKQTEQPFATPVPSRIPTLKDASHSRESLLPFPSAALPRAMQSGAVGDLPAGRWPPSSRVPQRPDSPYPGDPAVQTRRVYSSTTTPRGLPSQIPIVPRNNSRSRIRDIMMRSQAQRLPYYSAERNMHVNSSPVQSSRLIHLSRQPRGPHQPPEPSRPDRPLIAAPNVVQGCKRDIRHRSIRAEDVTDESLPQLQSDRRLLHVGQSTASRVEESTAGISRINVSLPAIFPAIELRPQRALSRRVPLTSNHLPHHPEPAQQLVLLQMQEAAA